jgi:hypothetical protein
MTDKTRLGYSIIAAALAAGALGDGLLRATPWGVNLFVWIAALATLAAGVLILNRVDLDVGGRWLVIPLLFFAAAIAWRDSPVLNALCMIGIVITLAMILMRSQAGKLLAAGVTDYALGVLTSLYNTLTGAGHLIGSEIAWKEIPRDGLAKHPRKYCKAGRPPEAPDGAAGTGRALKQLARWPPANKSCVNPLARNLLHSMGPSVSDEIQARVTLIAPQPGLRYHFLGLIERPTVRVKGPARSNRKINIT